MTDYLTDLRDRLKHSIATAMNDDFSEPRTELRVRHNARVMAMTDAADALTALIEAREAIIHLNALRTWTSDTPVGRKARSKLEDEAELLAARAIAAIDALGKEPSDE